MECGRSEHNMHEGGGGGGGEGGGTDHGRHGEGTEDVEFLVDEQICAKRKCGGGGEERTSEGAECKKRGMLSRSLIMQTRPA